MVSYVNPSTDEPFISIIRSLSRKPQTAAGECFVTSEMNARLYQIEEYN